MLEQDRLIERVRQQCAGDTRLDAALMYGSFTQGQADEWSDIEFWLFFADEALADVDPGSWCAAVDHTLLVVQNEFDTHVAVFESLIRGEFHFVPASAIDAVLDWSARGAPVDRMLVTDRSGRLRRVLEELPETPESPDSAITVERLCGRFVNWLLLGDSVLRRGETARAQAVLAEVNRHLLWLVRLIEQREFRPTPSRLADASLCCHARAVCEDDSACRSAARPGDATCGSISPTPATSSLRRLCLQPSTRGWHAARRPPAPGMAGRTASV